MIHRIGHIEPNPNPGDDKPEYVGAISTREGEQRVQAWVGRGGDMKDYINLYWKDHKLKVVAEKLDGEYYGNIDSEIIVPIVVKPIFNKRENIVTSFEIFYNDQTKD